MTLNTFRKNVVVAVAIFAAVVASVLLIVNIANAEKADVIKLTNGKEVRVGQSKESLEKAGASNFLRRINGDIYRYPADTNKPAEATIYLIGDKVSAVMVTRGAGNFQLVEKGIRLGASGKQLQDKFGKKLDDIDTQNDVVVQKGYKVVNSKTVSYYVTESCSGPKYDRVTVLAISQRGAEDRMTFLTKKRDCSKATGQTQAANPS